MSNSLHPKWKTLIERKTGLPFSDFVNCVVLFVSLLALIVGFLSLKFSIDGLKSAEKSGDAQQLVLEDSRKALQAVSDTLTEQTLLLSNGEKNLEVAAKSTKVLASIQSQQYQDALRRPRLKVSFWNSGHTVVLSSHTYDAATNTRRASGNLGLDLKANKDGRATFEVLIENIGDKDLLQAEIAVDCDAPIETTSQGVLDRSTPVDPDTDYWKIRFSKAILEPSNKTGDSAIYEFSTKGPYPRVFLPKNLFGCFVFVHASGLDPFAGGLFLNVID